MEELITIIVDHEKIKNFHRGDVFDMDFGYGNKVERRKVRIASKYRLRSGYSRVKFISIKKSVYPIDWAQWADIAVLH